MYEPSRSSVSSKLKVERLKANLKMLPEQWTPAYNPFSQFYLVVKFISQNTEKQKG